MSLESLIETINTSSLSLEIAQRLEVQKELSIEGGSRITRTLIASSLAQISSKSLLVIVPTLEEAGRWQSTLSLMGWGKSLLYPSSEVSPYENINVSTEISWGQLAVISELIQTNKSQNNIAIICTERALHNHLPDPDFFIENSLYINKGINLDLEDTCKKLIKIGYKRTNNTDQEGCWSRRGDILDIYAVNNELPIRIELYGDKVDKIKEFDPTTQRSLDEIEHIAITPIGFNIYSELDSLNINKVEDEREREENLEKSIQKLYSINGYNSSILDYINISTLIVLDEKDQCIAHTKDWLKYLELTYVEMNNYLKKNNIENILPKPISDSNTLYSKLKSFNLVESYLSTNGKRSLKSFNLNSKSITTYPNQFGHLSNLVKEFIKKKYYIWILSSQPSRTKALLEEHECLINFIQNNKDIITIKNLISSYNPVVLKLDGNPEIEGFNLAPWKILLITDKEFYGQQFISSAGYTRRRRAAVSKTIIPNKLKSGDFIVHRNHGVGRFLKIEKFVINNEARDYLLVQYLDGTLRVAADQLGSLGRYRNSSSKNPKVNKLGGSTWMKAKAKARKAISKVAIDLINLYAERSKTKGFAFPKDGPWQSELEDAFPYVPTPDQIKAVKEIKADMEKDIPMDRLVCGDVGFGKTEVAIRALFKAITAGKQVALLAPTTVLAQQHWRTLSDRFAPYPIKVSLLNRFKTSNERKSISVQLKEGKIDVIVGTHLLLSKKLSFKNLGLLVVDEEQRFGVAQKEKIKSIRKNIDVLTLSATPIPRTLYMSLSGVRKMSLITTPPPLRRSIKTHLTAMEDELIRSAICQEIGRGGQVFYVVPRVNGISEVANKIKQMIPNIKLLIAHGQMEEGDLENAMIAFNAGEADLMLCTTIIESGLDIPRVNTILVEDAHKFGLSQLYQLRGRVGRSGIQAHAWLFYPKHFNLNKNATERLRAIQQFSELGSGYQLAMRDMEIRGVGNLIGIEQSGQMEAIGFDLYMEILHESIAEIQGQNIPNVEETKVDLPITAFIPGTWIKGNEEKITAYKEASLCKNNEELLELTTTWIDRFGNLPNPVESLILIMKLKILTKKLGISRVKQVKPNIVLETQMNNSAFKTLLTALDSHLHGRVVYKKGTPNSEITLRGVGMFPIERQIELIMEWLEKMASKIPSMNNQMNERLMEKLS